MGSFIQVSCCKNCLNESVSCSEQRHNETVSRLVVSAHHVQAATVHQRRELMKADFSGVQNPLNLFQTSLGRNGGKNSIIEQLKHQESQKYSELTQ